ncbi:MAG: flagellar hook-length control protein FliK [Chitinophagales bacterium]
MQGNVLAQLVSQNLGTARPKSSVKSPDKSNASDKRFGLLLSKTANSQRKTATLEDNKDVDQPRLLNESYKDTETKRSIQASADDNKIEKAEDDSPVLTQNSETNTTEELLAVESIAGDIASITTGLLVVSNISTDSKSQDEPVELQTKLEPKVIAVDLLCDVDRSLPVQDVQPKPEQPVTQDKPDQDMNLTELVPMAPKITSDAAPEVSNSAVIIMQSNNPIQQLGNTAENNQDTENTPVQMTDKELDVSADIEVINTISNSKPEMQMGSSTSGQQSEDSFGNSAQNAKTEEPSKTGDVASNNDVALRINIHKEVEISQKLKSREARLTETGGTDKQIKSNDQAEKMQTDVRKIISFETGRSKGLLVTESNLPESKNLVDSNTTSDTNNVLENNSIVSKLESASIKTETASAKSESPNMINQVVKKIELMLKEKSSSVTIELKPEFLGKLHVELHVQDGILTARFTTDNQNVKHLLEGGIGQLRNALDSSGIRLDKAEVNVDLGYANFNRDFQQSDYQWGRQEQQTNKWWLKDTVPMEEVEVETDWSPYPSYYGEATVNYLV